MIEKEIIKKIHKIIEKNKTFLIVNHIRADGDAVGSALGLARYLKSIRKKVTCANADIKSLYTNFEFMLNKNEKFIDLKELIENKSTFDVLFILDCGELDRTGFEDKVLSLGRITIDIDHHITNDGYCDINYVDPESSSTSEIVYKILKFSKTRITKKIAEPLLIGLITDTRYFANNSTTAETLQIAGELINTGLDYSKVIEKINYRREITDLKLLGKSLLRLKNTSDEKLAWVTVPQKIFKKLKVPYHTLWKTGLAGMLSTLKNPVITFFLVEAEKEKVYLELRCKRKYNVEPIARHFGGGGHKYAAGAELNTTLKKAEKMVVEYIKSKII